jgi:hypothetical protein
MAAMAPAKSRVQGVPRCQGFPAHCQVPIVAVMPDDATLNAMVGRRRLGDRRPVGGVRPRCRTALIGLARSRPAAWRKEARRHRRDQMIDLFRTMTCSLGHLVGPTVSAAVTERPAIWIDERLDFLACWTGSPKLRKCGSMDTSQFFNR